MVVMCDRVQDVEKKQVRTVHYNLTLVTEIHDQTDITLKC